MELRHMRYFVVLAEELNFSRAAERLHISQPPLSRQIRELEQEIGARLFHRTKRQVELTPAGKVFLNKAYQILDQVEQASLSTRMSSTGMAGELRIGFTSVVQDLIPTLQRYRKQFPQVGINLRHMTSYQQIEALHERQLDVAVITIPVGSNKIDVLPLKKWPLQLVLPEHHPLATRTKVHLADLRQETFIMTPKSTGHLFYDLVMSVFEQAGFTPHITIQAHDMQTVMALVAGGMGVTLSPSPIEPYSGIMMRRVEDVDVTLQGMIAWRKDNQSEVLHEFLAFFRESAMAELSLT